MADWLGRGFGVALAIPNSLFGIRAEFFGIRMRHDEGHYRVHDFKRGRRRNLIPGFAFARRVVNLT